MSQQPTPKRRINVRAIIYHEGKLLAVKHKSADGRVSAYYATPGGGLDPHESLANGLIREIFEETGMQAQIGKLLFVQQFNTLREGYTEELEFFFEVVNIGDFLHIDISTTTHGKNELAICEFIDPSQVMIYPEFLQSINISDYIHHTLPTLVANNLR
ncbi:NUDIX domain-containing protein [Candidatus Saccharibacteria bacterium]|nr:NUDIX domain-containing protein [Candidatus Saccharibacteria bacterium]